MHDALFHHNRSEIGLAELLKALKLLKPESNETRTVIAKALGFNWKEVDESTMPELEQPIPSIIDPLKKIDQDVTPELKVPMESPDSKHQADSHGEILNPVRRENQLFEILFDNPILSSTEALEPTNIKLHMKRPRYQPLLQDIWFRGLIGAMLATSRASQEIEWTVLEREMIRGQLLNRLPFRQRPTLQRGVLLFLDRSESMQPFWRDEKELLRQLQRLLGEFKVRVRWLEVDRWSPDGPKLKWYSPYPHQFPEKTPLLLVSDFGIKGDLSGSQTNLRPWLPLIDLARRNICPLVALIPAPESYWPSILKQYIPYSFVWDHNTSIATVWRYRHRIR